MTDAHSRLFSLARCAIIVGLCLSSPGALAWNSAGHRLTAAIAWRHLDTETRAEAGRLLGSHADHPVWLARNPRHDPGYAAFVEASTWPDDIRRDPRFHDDDEPATPSIEGFPDTARHRRWHYIDQPLSAASNNRASEGELDRQLIRLGNLLANRNENSAARAYALAWLIHLVGDAHQPLHTVSRLDTDGRYDNGGNALWIENPFHPRRRDMTLHAYWDDLPGPPWLRGDKLEQQAGKLMPQSAAAATAGTVRQWLAEGRNLAETVVYEGLSGEVPIIDAAYHERAQRTAGERVAIAGKRLALLLNNMLGR